MILFIYFQREGKGGRKKGKETLIGCFSYMPEKELSLQPRHICLDWESNRWPFTLQNDAQPTDPRRSGRYSFTMYIWHPPFLGSRWHSFIHRINSEVHNLAYKTLCNLILLLPFQSFLCYSASFVLSSQQLGFFNSLWTCHKYTFFRPFAVAIPCAWNAFPSG